MKICGIYCIENLKNNKKYIGKSIDIKIRFIGHKSKLKHNKHENIYLQSSWNKHGEENFKFYIIEECLESELEIKEVYYIKKLKTKTPNGYNLTDGGEGLAGLKFSDDHKNKIRLSNLGKVVSSETRELLRMANLGKHKSKETIEKIRINAAKTTLGLFGCENPSYSQKRKGSKSKYMGVVWNNGNNSWQAQIRINGKTTYLGASKIEKECAKMYDEKAFELYGNKAKLNFPENYLGANNV